MWTDKHTAAVKPLQHALCNTAVLQMPDPTKLHTLKTCAFAYVLIAVLEQKKSPRSFQALKC